MFDIVTLKRIGKKLLSKEQTIAVAESVTAGMFQLALSTLPDATKFFQGGITTYNLGQKYKHLHVEPIHAQAVNCVSPMVAAQMALSVLQLFQSDWGIAMTGYATPVPESGNKVFAYFAVARAGRIKLKGKMIPKEKTPLKIQEEYISVVCKRLVATL